MLRDPVRHGNTQARYDVVKRSVDIIGSALGLALTLPVQAVIAAVVRVSLGSPVFFRQQRPGRDGEIFTLVKFRTMTGPDLGPSTDHARLTAVGKILRAGSLDELPTLFNVLKGDMSLIGPRPLLVSYLDRYSPEQARRHEVRPGITGLAQVSGRNALSWEERLRLDVAYVDRRCARLDLAIMLRTIACVVGRGGIAAPGQSTMPEFLGPSIGSQST